MVFFGTQQKIISLRFRINRQSTDPTVEIIIRQIEYNNLLKYTSNGGDFR